MEKITKEEVIYGIEVCARIENIWRNGDYPKNSYLPAVISIKKTLTKLLDVANVS